jgi:hypothetical protein
MPGWGDDEDSHVPDVETDNAVALQAYVSEVVRAELQGGARVSRLPILEYPALTRAQVDAALNKR